MCRIRSESKSDVLLVGWLIEIEMVFMRQVLTSSSFGASVDELP